MATILIVDDNLDEASVLEEILSMHGHKVAVALRRTPPSASYRGFVLWNA